MQTSPTLDQSVPVPPPAARTSTSAAEGYLGELQSLAAELEVAIEAIGSRQLTLLEDSLHRQRAACTRLAGASRPTPPPGTDLAGRIGDATRALQALNLRYSALIEHFGGTVRLFSCLHRAQAGSAHAPAAATRVGSWSCQL